MKTPSGNGQAWSSASPRGQWRTGKNGENGCKIICGAPTTLAVKGLMMMNFVCYFDLAPAELPACGDSRMGEGEGKAKVSVSDSHLVRQEDNCKWTV